MSKLPGRVVCWLPIVFVMVGCNNGSTNSQTRKDTSTAAANDGPLPAIQVKYYYTAESVYRDAQIEGNTLRLTYLSQGAIKRLSEGAEKSVESKPFWTERDLTTKTAELSDQEVRGLADTVQRSGFMELQSIYGPEGRSYPEGISVQVDSAVKKVIFRHSPQAPAMPPPFADVRRALFELIDRKFQLQLVQKQEPK